MAISEANAELKKTAVGVRRPQAMIRMATAVYLGAAIAQLKLFKHAEAWENALNNRYCKSSQNDTI